MQKYFGEFGGITPKPYNHLECDYEIPRKKKPKISKEKKNWLKVILHLFFKKH